MHIGARKRRSRWLIAIAVACVLVLSAFPALGFLAGRVRNIADADYLLLHELIPNLVGGGSVSDWHIPYATYLLPDWPLYALALILGWTPAATIAIFAWLQFLLLAGAIFVFARAVDRRRAGILTIVTLSVVVLAVLLNAFPLIYLAASYVHGGTAIFTVATLGLVVAWQREPTRWVLAATSALTFVASASDRLFVTWSLAPAAAAVLLLAWIEPERRRKHATWLLAQVGAFVAALPVPGLIFPHRSSYDLTLGFSPIFGLRRFGSSMRLVDQLSPWMIPTAALATVVSLWVLLRGKSLFGHTFQRPLRLAVACFGITSAVLTVASQVAMVGAVPPHARYSTNLFLLPLVVAPVMLAAGISDVRASAPRIAATAVVVLPLLAAFVYPFGWLNRVDPDQSARPIDCIEAAIPRDATHGISSYWDARQFQVYSENRLKMSEFGSDLRPLLVNSNEAELVPTFDFAVLSNLYGGFDLPKDRLEALAGPPRRTTTCGAWTVLDYGVRGLDLEPFNEVGATRVFDGCTLDTHMGTVTAACELRVDQAPAEDYLVLGPYAPAPPGRYRIRVNYRSTMPEDATLGEWDVTNDPPGNVVVGGGQLRGTNDATRTLDTEISVDGPREARLQWRLDVPAGASAVVDSVTITRLA